jgi:photosystem II stability/assembly factor-like uncharacterized protein
MLTPTSGWAIGQVETDLSDHVLFTYDEGRTWQDRTPGAAIENQPAEGLSAAAFFDTQGNAWVTYSPHQPTQPMSPPSGVWRTTDVGVTWQPGQAFDVSGMPADFFSVVQLGFFDGQHGWALAQLGAGMSHDYVAIYTTADAGQTWQRVVDPQKNPELMACSKTGVAFSGESTGWLTGDCPGLLESLFFYTSIDKGQSWQQAVLSPPGGEPAKFFSQASSGCGIPDLVYSSAQALLLSVRCSAGTASKAWLYTGKDFGLLEARPLPVPYGTLFFRTPEEGWLLGARQNNPVAPGEIYHTTDGGKTWTLVIKTAWQGTADFVSGNTGWVVAQSADRLALVLTEDGGKTWQALQPVIAP